MEDWEPRKEEEILEFWEREKIFEFKEGKKIFSIDTPPPYPSGTFHIAQTIHYLQIDMIARTARMLGYSVLFPLGIDRNGLPVETYVEKKYNRMMHEMQREEFIELCKEALDEREKEIIEVLKRGGLSFNKFYRTDSPEYRKLTQATFIELFKRGLIYEADRPVNYCPVCKTTIADAEIEYKKVKSKLVYIKFKVKESGEFVTIATTRPELLCTCLCVIYHPEDERYKKLRGKHLIVPIYEQEVPVIEHSYAKKEFGTGLVMICSYGDTSDIRIVRELGLKAKVAIDEDGRMNELAGAYKGLKVAEERKRIIEDLREKGLVEKVEEIEHQVPTCWRSRNPIEFINMKEFFLKQMEFLPELKKLLRKIKFLPPLSKKLLLDWMNSVNSDWPISRRRYYGTEIPIWYCENCGALVLPKANKYYRPWKEEFPGKKCPKCGSTKLRGEERTLDTWMDSSISELYILKYGEDEEFFRKAFPCTLRPQGKDIVRTWLFYSLLRVYQLLKDRAFEMVWISGLGLDKNGRPMHKSLGNVIYPMPLFEKYGADAVRFFGAAEINVGEDFRINEQKIQGASKFLRKLWNVAKFVTQFQRPKRVSKLEPSDEWIISLTNKLIEECRRGYKKLNFFIPANRIRNFVWETFAPHYLEMVKARAYGKGFSKRESEAARYTLYYC
ncbi:MAG TPA: valine--tRNA ligase, partial [Candidatus Aenigmarchaeota archaeon]|nr:valine--tRNA ligase [Candidatus Aenigmarchaeota archaeon]